MYTLVLKSKIFLLTFIISSLACIVAAQSGVTEDEASCICGINVQLLQKVESIMKAAVASTPTCASSVPSLTPVQAQALLSNMAGSKIDDPANSNSVSSFENQPIHESGLNQQTQQSKAEPLSEGSNDLHSLSTSNGEHSDPVEHESNNIDIHQQPVITSANAQEVAQMISKLTSEIHQLESQYHLITSSSSATQTSTTYNPISTSNSNQPYSLNLGHLLNNNNVNNINNNNNNKEPTPSAEAPPALSNPPSPSPLPAPQNSYDSLEKNPVVPMKLENNGFLGGLSTPIAAYGQSGEGQQLQIKFNQSQKVDPQLVQETVQTTIPGVVSNIFSNIQNLTIQAEHDHQSATQRPTNSLTSIDGSSISIKGDSSEQIEAEGEKLFLQWIEHQVNNLHLTASMAAYIRRSAMNLFRNIIRQYIRRVERLGGNIEVNVQRATQMALTNTQTLISFLLKHYLSFSGGLMQIIGEQVSRVGKQLDSTGESIAHVSLNPFDIVSNVFESLPNPSTYANYFRAFGKQLMGEHESTTPSPTEAEVEQQQQQVVTPTNHRPQNLLMKTVGALGKTFGWKG